MSNMKLEHYIYIYTGIYMGVSKNKGTPKSSILIRFSTINHPFWGTPIFGNTHIYIYRVRFGCFDTYLAIGFKSNQYNWQYGRRKNPLIGLTHNSGS